VPTPDFVEALRRHVGQAELWLPGVTAVVRRGEELLLVRRRDNGQWGPVGGIVEPAEEPAVTAQRETLEETGVTIRVDRLASIGVTDPVVYPNGDRVVYLDHTFACTWLAGEAHVADEESTEIGWFHRDHLPELPAHVRERVDDVLADEPATRFRS
jgi:8-oxo-dGTP pyrophosphatase MutT (NUDIX family)